MNFKQVELNAENDGTQFDKDFLSTLISCKQYVSLLRELRRGYTTVFTEVALKNIIREHAKTLRCFVNCCK